MGRRFARQRILPIAIVALLGAATSGCLTGPKSAGHDFLSGQPYSKLAVEIDYADGQAPRSSAASLLQQRIQERLNKAGGVTLQQTAFTPTDSSYSVDELRALEAKHRNGQTGGDTIVLYVLYLNGHSDLDTSEGKVLGVHYGRESIAVFKESVDSSSFLGLGFGSEDLEKSVLIHEFGHALGLVNNGVGMVRPHEDADHPKHSSNQDSVMYWAVENTLGLPLLSTTPPTQFDSDDVADLRAAGGKG